MPATSSREARSARREAMKSNPKKAASKSRVTKASIKPSSKLPKTVDSLPDLQLRATPEPEPIYKESEAQTERASAQSSPEQESLPEIPAVSTPQPQEIYEPLTPPTDEQGKSEQDTKLILESTMSEDELQTYIREFEATYRGADSEAEEVIEPLSPNEASFEPKPSSPLALDCSFDVPSDVPLEVLSDSNLDLSYFGPEELRIDDYIDCSNDAPETDAVEMLHEKPKRICVYRSRAEPNPALFSVTPNKRTLFAAWRTVIADGNYYSREAYVHSVLLAAASLNQRSLLSGHARQTMAPALGTSH